MGRTIPSFRIASAMEEREWKSFRNSLDKSDRKKNDQMFSIDVYKIYYQVTFCVKLSLNI
jgi:hypothetical protein